MEKFTFEEINLICCFKGENRAATVADMTAAIPYMEKEIQELAQQTIYKLHNSPNINLQQLISCESFDILIAKLEEYFSEKKRSICRILSIEKWQLVADYT